MEAPIIAALIAAGGVVLTLAARVVLGEQARRHERQAVVTAFRSDIRSIVQVIDLMGLVDQFIGMAVRASLPSPDLPTWVDAPRDEDYFQLYGSMAPKIGLTPAPLAREIVRFYTFLHASRDAATPLGALRSAAAGDGRHLEPVRNVLLALSEVLRAAEAVLGSDFSGSGRSDGQEDARRLRLKIEEALGAAHAAA